MPKSLLRGLSSFLLHPHTKVGFQSPSQFGPWIPLLLGWLFWVPSMAGQAVCTCHTLKIFFVTRRIKSFKNKAIKNAVRLECLDFGVDLMVGIGLDDP